MTPRKKNPVLQPPILVTVPLNLSDTYSQIQQKLAAVLRVDTAPCLRLWASSGKQKTAYSRPQPSRDNDGNEVFLATISGRNPRGGKMATDLLLCWDLLDISVVDFENSVTLTIDGFTRSAEKVGSCSVRIPRDAPLEQLLTEVSPHFLQVFPAVTTVHPVHVRLPGVLSSGRARRP